MATEPQEHGERGGSDELIDSSNGEPPSWLTDQRKSGDLGSSQHPFPDVTEPSDSLATQNLLFQDYDWYSLSFAEAGVEQFAGLEPSTLFQQGWSTFS